jgi:CRP-like cAMP-binding protein
LLILPLMYVSIGDARVLVGEISPGEPFGPSSLLADQTYTTTARAESDSRVLHIDARELRGLCAADCSLGVCLLQQVACAAIEQVQTTQIQLTSVRVWRRLCPAVTSSPRPAAA